MQRHAGWMFGIGLFAVSCSGANNSGDDIIGTSMMAIYTLPSGTSAAGTTYPYSLSIPAAGASSNGEVALTAAAPDARSSLQDSPEWQARLRYEQRRNEQIDRVAAAMQRGYRPLRRRLVSCASSCAADQNQMCWKGQCTTNPNIMFVDGTTLVRTMVVGVVPVPAVAPSTAINVVLDQTDYNANADAAAQALQAAQRFASTLSRELTILGRSSHNAPADIDGDGRMTMVFSSENGSAANADDFGNLAGFFSVADAIAANTTTDGIQADGNQADLLWLRVPGTTLATHTPVTPLLIAGTMAHEYTHLTSFALRVLGGTQGREELWLDEAIAHTMEDVTGWGPSTSRVFESTLNDWSKSSVFASGTDSVDQRGVGYTLVRHLIDKQAKANGASDAGSDAAHAAAASVIGGLINDNALGFQHTVFSSLRKVGMGQWLMGVFITGDSQYQPAVHGEDYLATATDSITGNTIGFNPRGAYKDANGDDFTLSGPAATDIDTSTPYPLTGSLDESASVFYVSTGQDATRFVQTETVNAYGPFVQLVLLNGAH